MSKLQLPNYLRANRKRLALSQDEMAFLLGTETGERVCRHERFLQAPGLEAALAYEVIFRKPVRELFNGLFRRIENEVAARARSLANRPDGSKPGQRSDRKRQAVRAIAAMPLNNTVKPS